MWIIYALLAAITASLVAVFAKLGLREIDTTLATTVRAIVMTLFLIAISIVLKKFDGFSMSSFSSRDWMLIVLAGIAGGLSLLFYFIALRDGPASAVVSLDRLSLVFVAVLAVFLLGETFNWQLVFGTTLMVTGAILITFR